MTSALTIAMAGLASTVIGLAAFGFRVSSGRFDHLPLATRVLVPGGLVLATLAIGTILATGQHGALWWAIAAVLLSGAALALHGLGRVPTQGIRVRIGDTLPAFSAPDSTGQTVASGSYAGQRLILKFYRGHWCPFCQAELKRFAAMREELKEWDVEIVAISKDTPQEVSPVSAFGTSDLISQRRVSGSS